MNNTMGVFGVFFGLMFLLWGRLIAGLPASHVKNIFTGTPMDRSAYFYLGGAAFIIYGLLMMAAKRK